VSDRGIDVETAPEETLDAGAYCRQVEAYLTRANGGHLVRIVGPGFALVRQWAADGIPLRVVYRGIDHKVERHRAGQARRPLRIEFCDADVRDVYEDWQRAVGLTTRGAAGDDAAAESSAESSTESSTEASTESSTEVLPADRRRPSLSKHLDRALERIGRTAGRLELPEQLREGLGAVIAELAAVRDAAKTLRGSDRDALAERVARLDRDLVALARASAGAELLAAVRRDAEQDLSSYRGRLSSDAWAKALEATADQLLRDRLGLPTLET
jgi:hypothetical protein